MEIAHHACEGGLAMMFFFHKDKQQDSSYHWHRDCQLVPASVQADANWMMSNMAPSGRGECLFCNRIDQRAERRTVQSDPRGATQAATERIRREPRRG